MEPRKNIIERAFELPAEGLQLEEIRRGLSQEGYTLIQAHLGGRGIRDELIQRRATASKQAASIAGAPPQPPD